MESVPLIAHDAPESVVAYRATTAITARQFLADVTAVAAVLPDARPVLNVCSDRYRFAVGLAACLVSQKTSLLPPTLTPDVLGHLRAFAPDAVCLTDASEFDVDLPVVRFPSAPAAPLDRWQVPCVHADQRAAYVFTSGSTGVPVPHSKTWGRLVQSVRVEAERLGPLNRRPAVILATVPPQHMYGFETSVLLALQNGHAFCAERPFYPADIAGALAFLPRPRVLVSTPIHLRALLAAGIPLPEVDLVVSATAPLDAMLASEVERHFGAQLLEIYGSTETGQIASRRTSATLEWHLWPGVELVARDGRVWAQGGHIEAPIATADVLEVTTKDHFVLHGRTADLVNIAGKRSSFAYLNHQLNAIPGVIDGAFFLADDRDPGSVTGVARLGAVVVAPGLTAAAVAQQLRACLDPAFMPRPLLLVDDLPRASTGKLPLSALKALTARR